MNGSVSIGLEIFEIVWINILLSGDNAILIALACRDLPPQQRRWGVLLGALGGVVLRILFTLVIVQLMAVPYLKLAGGALLLIIAVKLLVDETDHSKVHAKPSLWAAVGAIITADAVMSLDNVIAIAAAAKGSMWLIVFGIAVSVPIVMFGAGFLMKVLERVPALVWAGAALLGWVAGEMAASDPLLEHMRPGGIDLDWALPIAGCALAPALAFVIEKWKGRRDGA